MPEFVNPFSGIVPHRKMSKEELTRVIRLSLAAEEKGVNLYEALSNFADDALAKKVLQDIADEKRVHSGKFQRLLNFLLDDEEDWLAQGLPR